MKILHVIDSGGLYGAEIMLLSLMIEQRLLGHEPWLCSIGGKGSPEKPIEASARQKDLNVRPWRMADGLNLAGALRILEWVKRDGFDLLHTHGYKGNILFGWLPRSFRRLPIVTTLHGWTNTGGMNRMRFYEWLDARSLHRIESVVLVNQAMLGNHRLRRVRCVVIDNGIDLDGTLSLEEKPLVGSVVGFCGSRFTVGAIGRLSPEKGFDDLVSAVGALVRSGFDLNLVIIGEGPLHDELAKGAVEAGLDGRFLLCGYLEGASRYLSHFKAFVLPSLTEGLPITLLEAMASSTPVVASRVGGIPEALDGGRGGLLVEPQDPEGLALAIRTVMEHYDEAVTRARHSHAVVRQRYTTRRMAEEYDLLYRKTLEPKRRPRQ